MSRPKEAPWWKDRFPALFLPNIRYGDGSVGFLQLDVSLNPSPSRKDLRVVAFEDRHDCAHAAAVMHLWPEYSHCEFDVGVMPTSAIQSELEASFERAAEAAAAAGQTLARPNGLVVMRRGKLALRVGMSLEEFMQLVVYQAAAQLSLSRIGYKFDDQ